jgi:hypothetical protein
VSECAWQLLLIGMGVLLEGGGIALVVLDVREARSQARAVLKSEPPVLPDTEFTLFERAMPITSVGGREPTREERLARLETKVGENHEQVAGWLVEVRNNLRKDLGEQISAAIQTAEKRDSRLRQFLADQLDAGIGRRVLGAVLFGLGLLLQAVANVIGIL